MGPPSDRSGGRIHAIETHCPVMHSAHSTQRPAEERCRAALWSAGDGADGIAGSVLLVRDPGNRIRAGIRDGGLGPPFTLKAERSVGAGRDGGPAVVKGLVASAGERIHFESTPGQGTRLDAFLPRGPGR